MPMEVNEALARILVGHWRVLLTCLLLPVIAVTALQVLKTPEYVATTRLQASSSPPGSDTEADSVLNRVKGIATSPDVVGNALARAGIGGRSATAVAADEVTVARLGSAAVFDLSVTDPSPAVAGLLSRQISAAVVDFLNDSGNQTVALMTKLINSQTAAITKRETIAAKLQLTSDPLTKADLTAQLSTLDEEIGNLASSVRQLQVTNATGGSAALISQPAAAQKVVSTLPTDLAIAAIAGLVIGLLLASVLELVRPTVSGARPFAEQLGAPLLGTLLSKPGRRQTDLDAREAAAHEALIRLRRVATRSGVTVLVLVGQCDPGRLRDLASLLNKQLQARRPVAARAEKPRNGTALERVDVNSAATTMTLPVVAAPPAGKGHGLRVVALSDVDGTEGTEGTDRYGLLVLISKRTPFAEVDRVTGLSGVTGWPVTGVMADNGTRAGRS